MKKKSITMYYADWYEEDDFGFFICRYRFHASHSAAQNTLNRKGGGLEEEVRPVRVPTDPKGLRDFLNNLVSTELGTFQGCAFLLEVQS